MSDKKLIRQLEKLRDQYFKEAREFAATSPGATERYQAMAMTVQEKIEELRDAR